MRWLWIDRIIELVPGERLVAVKNVSAAEEVVHDQFPANRGEPAMPMLPGALVVEAMAQTAGILVGHAGGFEQKVILAKVSSVRLDSDATPGCTLRLTAELVQRSAQGAATKGVLELRAPNDDAFRPMGAIDLVFSHLDQNAAGTEYPEHNFVFGPMFRDVLRNSGIDPDAAKPLPL